jgi:acetoin utilization deacetylase AcuC-like enzyme
VPKTGFVYNDIFLKHEVMPGHPERPERLGAILEMLDETGLANELRHIAPREATAEDLTRIHEPHYVDFVRRAVESRHGGHVRGAALVRGGAHGVGRRALRD